MTDLNQRFAAMLDGEPTPPFDLDRVVAGGRRALRRRNTLAAVAGTAGTAAVTAAVVVPIAATNHGGGTSEITVLASPTPSPSVRCDYVLTRSGLRDQKLDLQKALKKMAPKYATGYSVRTLKKAGRSRGVFEICPKGSATPGIPGEKTPSPDPTSTMPPYHYSADPQTIADGFGSELTQRVKALGFTIIYNRPFAQETSTLEKGHPTYFDGNVDVRLPDGPADIGVQVTHAVTEMVPFDDKCDPPSCTQTKLPDGTATEVSRISSGSGGAEVITVEIHHPDGLVVEAQESNYGFGPEATGARSSQPLTVDQLTTLAEDPAFAF